MKKVYDLEERTSIFSENVIDFCLTIEENTISRVIIRQLVRSATSVGANYCEANGASSDKDFANKIFICKKECQETKYWLRLIKKCNPSEDALHKLTQEVHELVLIFQKITGTMRKQSQKHIGN